MRLDDVKARVAAIAEMADDDERAHCAEDDLRQAVLSIIAEGSPDAAALAAEALKTTGIEFSRWCA